MGSVSSYNSMASTYLARLQRNDLLGTNTKSDANVQQNNFANLLQRDASILGRSLTDDEVSTAVNQVNDYFSVDNKGSSAIFRDFGYNNIRDCLNNADTIRSRYRDNPVGLVKADLMLQGLETFLKDRMKQALKFVQDFYNNYKDSYVGDPGVKVSESQGDSY